jgi:hypothetical protein
VESVGPAGGAAQADRIRATNRAKARHTFTEEGADNLRFTLASR